MTRTRRAVVLQALDKSRLRFRREPCSLQANFIGSDCVKLHFYLPLAILLAACCQVCSQQDHSLSRLESLLQTARESQQRGDDASAARAYREALSLRPDLAQLWSNLGLIQHEQKLYPEAIDSLQQAHRRDPSLFVPNLFLGIDLLQIGKTDEAMPYLVKAVQLKKDDPQVHLALGRGYRAQGKLALAASEFNRVIELDPQQSSAWFSLGLVYLDVVERDSRRMSSEYRSSAYAKALLAESLVKQARYHEAADVYQDVLSSNSKPPCMRSELGFIYLKQGDVSKASAEYATETRENPACSLAILGNARVAIETGSYRDASATLTQLWERDHGFMHTDTALLTDGLPANALSSFTAFLALQHDSAAIPTDLYELLSAAFKGIPVSNKKASASAASSRLPLHTVAESYAMGRYQECARQELPSLNTKETSALRLLASCSFFTGDYVLSSDAGVALTTKPMFEDEGLYWSIRANEQLAFRALDRYQQLQPDSERTHLLLGDIYRQRRRNDDAIEEYKRALQLSPGDPAALLGLSTAYLLNGNYPATVETLRPALNRVPDDADMNLVMGEAFVESQQYADAEIYLQRALSAKPQMIPHVHALLGRVYANSGRPADALEQLKMGLSSDEDGSIHYQLAKLYRQKGDSKDAAAAIDQMKELQRRRREAAVVAIRDEHPSNLDDGP